MKQHSVFQQQYHIEMKTQVRVWNPLYVEKKKKMSLNDHD